MPPRSVPDEPAAGPGSGSRVVLAVDVGGTKLAAGLVDDAGQVLVRAQVPTPQVGSGRADEVFGALADLVDGVRAQGDAVGIRDPAVCGVGSGGPMSAGGREVSPLNIAAWRDFPLQARLADHVELEVFVDNDAKALALAEGWRGAAQGVDDYLAMVVSTGIGGGVVLDGDLLDGAAGNAGHIGHLNVEPDGRRLSVREHRLPGGGGVGHGHRRDHRCAGGPGRARRWSTGWGCWWVERWPTWPSCWISGLAVVAGSVALGYGHPFFTAAQAEIDRRARLDFARGCRIIPAGLGDAGPLVGAAAVGRGGRAGACGRVTPAAGAQ